VTRIFVVEDESGVRYMLDAILRAEGFEATSFPSAEAALAAPADPPPDLVLTDLVMPGKDGVALLVELQRRYEGLPVIVLTARGSERHAVRAMKAGAWDYLVKPFDVAELLTSVRGALERRALRRENQELRAQLALSRPLLYRSRAMGELMSLVHRVADRNVTVLLLGETGTGKEVIATALHELSSRRSGPLVAAHLAAVPATLVESELFGHERGAFSGASKAHAGLFERADGGTLLLDEVGDLPADVQVKLLRVLQEREVSPLGAEVSRKVDVRLLAATHRDLRGDVEAGRFRQDLWYRLNVVTLTVPPLRERREDVPLLASHFAMQHARRFGVPEPLLDPAFLQAIAQRDWRGNVRELEHAIERVVILGGGTLGPADLAALDGPLAEPADDSLRARVAAYEAGLIREALARHGGNQSAAARALKLSRGSLIEKMHRHGLHDG
jgi:two-component system response regulator AtoC